MMNDLFVSGSRYVTSVEACEGAKRLIENVDKGKIELETLPNSYRKFTGELEEADYTSYSAFINSANGYNLLSVLEEEDARDYVEL